MHEQAKAARTELDRAYTNELHALKNRALAAGDSRTTDFVTRELDRFARFRSPPPATATNTASSAEVIIATYRKDVRALDTRHALSVLNQHKETALLLKKMTAELSQQGRDTDALSVREWREVMDGSEEYKTAHAFLGGPDVYHVAPSKLFVPPAKGSSAR